MSALPAEPPHIDRSFTAIRSALPAGNAAAFDAQLTEITQAGIPDLTALDEFLTFWHRIAVRIAADPGDWEHMNQAADDLLSGKRQPGPTMAEVLARRGVNL